MFTVGWHLAAQILYFVGSTLVLLSMVFSHLQFCCRRERLSAFRTLSGVLLFSCMTFIIISRTSRSGSRKNIFRVGGLAPHHLGGNNEQNYCVQLSSIKQLMYRNYPENLGGLGKFWGACAPLAPT